MNLLPFHVGQQIWLRLTNHAKRVISYQDVWMNSWLHQFISKKVLFLSFITDCIWCIQIHLGWNIGLFRIYSVKSFSALSNCDLSRCFLTVSTCQINCASTQSQLSVTFIVPVPVLPSAHLKQRITVQLPQAHSRHLIVLGFSFFTSLSSCLIWFCLFKSAPHNDAFKCISTNEGSLTVSWARAANMFLW